MKKHMLLGITLLSLGILHGCSGSDNDWLITDEGIGPLTAKTAFDYSNFDELLPDLHLNQGLGIETTENKPSEAETTENPPSDTSSKRFEVVFVYNSDLEKVFTLIPTPDPDTTAPSTTEGDATSEAAESIDSKIKTIKSIEIHSPAYKTTGGFGLQSAFADIYPDASTAKCKLDTEEGSSSVICTAPESDRIRFMFSGDWTGVDGELPTYDLLKDWTAERLIWLAEAPPVEIETTTESEPDKKSDS